MRTEAENVGELGRDRDTENGGTEVGYLGETQVMAMGGTSAGTGEGQRYRERGDRENGGTEVGYLGETQVMAVGGTTGGTKEEQRYRESGGTEVGYLGETQVMAVGGQSGGTDEGQRYREWRDRAVHTITDLCLERFEHYDTSLVDFFVRGLFTSRCLRLSGHPSGQGTGSEARTRVSMVFVELKADSLSTVPPTPPCLFGMAM
ncbi:hypothetical protein PoB_001966600 [Plakobranchus ocellatus]|uniref:Uncharacterized protein n=1 Tax=Plakobranchus ocellatus TaxID=259542 RepID=A0AAV3ZEW8_9GAST|nr:hypothetical protein PoB_001966600 [Plakobranchus ocellatus]